MKKRRRWIGFLCICLWLLSFTTVEASDEKDDTITDMGSPLQTNRVPLLELTPGNEEGEIGYSGSERFGYWGPDSFAVEDGMIYILDSVNCRILVYEGDEYSFSIDISELSQARHMKYSDGKLGIVDNNNGLIGIYTITGELITLIEYPYKMQNVYVANLEEVGDSYVVWETYDGSHYCHDWISKTTVNITSPDLGAGWQIDSKNAYLSIMGVHDDGLIYVKREYVSGVDMFFVELSVHRVTRDGEEVYAVVDFSDWHAAPSEPFYLSTDGKVYVMDCLEERVIISELILGTTDQSRMPELEIQAAERRAISAAAEAVASTNSVSSDMGFRKTVKPQAVAMLGYQCTVLANRKTAGKNIMAITMPLDDLV